MVKTIQPLLIKALCGFAALPLTFSLALATPVTPLSDCKKEPSKDFVPSWRMVPQTSDAPSNLPYTTKPTFEKNRFWSPAKLRWT